MLRPPHQVRWRRDGKELFYIALDGRLMAVPIRIAPNEQAIEAGSPIPLFVTRVGGALTYPNNQQYDVLPDGQRFLMNTIIEQVPSPITVIRNRRQVIQSVFAQLAPQQVTLLE